MILIGDLGRRLALHVVLLLDHRLEIFDPLLDVDAVVGVGLLLQVAAVEERRALVVAALPVRLGDVEQQDRRGILLVGFFELADGLGEVAQVVLARTLFVVRLRRFLARLGGMGRAGAGDQASVRNRLEKPRRRYRLIRQSPIIR